MPMARLFPEPLARPGEVTITPWSYQSIGVALYSVNAIAPSSQNFVTADLGVFIPFVVPEAVTVTKLFWVNGTAVAGNLDAGIFAPSGALLVSTGSTAASGTSTVQSVDVTDTVLARGVYYLGLASDTSGATQKLSAVVPAAGILQSLGLLQQATAFPFATNANPATFAVYASAFIPIVGLQAYRTFGP